MTYRVLVLLALLAALPLPAWAAAPTDAEIERVITAMRLRQEAENLLPRIEALQRQFREQYASSRNLGPEQLQMLERLQARNSERMRQLLAWDDVKPVYMDAYRRNFSSKDLRAMAKFYESDAGQRLLDNGGTVMQEVGAALQQKLLPLLQQMEGELDAELKALAEQQEQQKAEETMAAPPVSPAQKRRNR